MNMEKTSVRPGKGYFASATAASVLRTSTPTTVVTVTTMLFTKNMPMGEPAKISRKFSNSANCCGIDFDDVMRALKAIRNLDGLVITVPHKFNAFQHCNQATERASFLRAVSVMPVYRSGTLWEGDMCDGQGFVDAYHKKGGVVAGKRSHLLGAGEARHRNRAHCSSIRRRPTFMIHDIDEVRQRQLVQKLRQPLWRSGPPPAQ